MMKVGDKVLHIICPNCKEPSFRIERGWVAAPVLCSYMAVVSWPFLVCRGCGLAAPGIKVEMAR